MAFLDVIRVAAAALLGCGPKEARQIDSIPWEVVPAGVIMPQHTSVALRHNPRQPRSRYTHFRTIWKRYGLLEPEANTILNSSADMKS
jgi:hypothetical protein